MSLNQSHDVAVIRATQQIAFPVPRNRSICCLGTSFADGDGADELAA
jgi:hypothetical protein